MIVWQYSKNYMLFSIFFKYFTLLIIIKTWAVRIAFLDLRKSIQWVKLWSTEHSDVQQVIYYRMESYFAQSRCVYPIKRL